MTDERLPGKPIDLPRLALSLGRLALVGFSLVLVGKMLWLSASLRSDFAAHNVLGVKPRQTLLLALGAGLCIPTLLLPLALAVVRRRPGFLDALQRLSIWCAPLGVAFVLPGLFVTDLAEAKPLFYLTVLLAFGVSFQKLLAQAFAQRRARPARPFWTRVARYRAVRVLPLLCVLACAAWFALVLGRSAISHHRLIQTISTDVGIADNVMANLLHRHAFSAPALFGRTSASYSSVHGEYGAILFLPIYALKPGAETLLWLQVVLAALAAIPLYFLVAERLGSRAACWFGIAYLLSAPLHGALLAGFSWLPAVILLSFTLFFAIETERRWLVGLSAVVLLAVSEQGALAALAFALHLLVSRKQMRLALVLLAASGAVLVLHLVRSVHGAGAVEQPPLLGALGTLAKNPAYFVLDLARAVKLTSVMHALAPLCVLPFFEAVCWPLFLPALLATSAATAYWPDPHAAPEASLTWIAPCFLALAITLGRRRDRAEGRSQYAAWLVALAITQLSHSYDFGALLRRDGFGGQPANALFRMTPEGAARYAALQRVLHALPNGASVATTDYLLPHVSSHAEAYWLGRSYGEPDFILLSNREIAATRAPLEASFRTKKYRIVAQDHDEFYLFGRGPEDEATSSVLKQLGLSAN